MKMSRFETFGDKKIRIVPQNTTNLMFAQQVARERLDNDDPFAILNLSTVADRFFEWKQKLPRVEPFYAVKSNNDLMLLKMLADLGAGFDCASKSEIEQVIKNNLADSSRIIYANPCKTRSFIKHAGSQNVKLMTFDSREELLKIHGLHPNPELVLRIMANDETAQCQLSAKYGCEPLKEAVELLKLAAGLLIPVVGISFHVGSGCHDPTAFEHPIAHARRLFDIGLNLNHKMHLLDIGGGFPGDDDALFDKIVEVITPCLDKHFPPNLKIRLIAEPGRFFASKPMSIVANVLSAIEVPASRISEASDESEENGFMYYLNDGVYGQVLFRNFDLNMNAATKQFKHG